MQYYSVGLLRTILVSSYGLKESHYNSRVSLHEAPTKRPTIERNTMITGATNVEHLTGKDDLFVQQKPLKADFAFKKEDTLPEDVQTTQRNTIHRKS